MKKSYRLTPRPDRVALALSRRPAPVVPGPCPLCDATTGGYGETRSSPVLPVRPLSLRLRGLRVVRHLSETCTMCTECGFLAYLGVPMKLRIATKFADALPLSRPLQNRIRLLSEKWARRSRKVAVRWLLCSPTRKS